jgi:oligoendopeptidase F
VIKKSQFFLVFASLLFPFSASTAGSNDCTNLLTQLNAEYLKLHKAKEKAFWAQRMHLPGTKPDTFEKAELALKAYTSDPKMVERIEAELKEAVYSEEEKTGLQGWLRFFKSYTISDPQAISLQAELLSAEQKLYNLRNHEFKSGYKDPETGKFVAQSGGVLATTIKTHPNEAVRKAAYQGLLDIETFVLNHGFVEIVKLRNKLARQLGYKDYYDYKLTITEGLSKDQLFEVFDDLEVKTRVAQHALLDGLIAKLGAEAILPWNLGHYSSGDVETRLDPYYSFSQAVERWGKTMAALGIDYKGATIQIDLLDRKGKYSNGFMHGPVPSLDVNGAFSPAAINFSANASPAQIGSGKRAATTLAHEGGHAAHFSNICMPGACFSQEFAPTSVASAETQSMFLDDIVDRDPQWLARYATHCETGQPMPAELIKDYLVETQRFLAHELRSMLLVSLFEKDLYEMPESEMTAENILALARKKEQNVLFMSASPRPLLSIPHLPSGEGSAYYHGYLLAQMAVYQTQDYFFGKYGYITDNPNVGPELREKYWKPGNSKTFFEFIQSLTGKPFSADSAVARVNASPDEIRASVDAALEAEKHIPRYTKPIRLKAKIRMVHGSKVIASNANRQGFKKMAKRYGKWIAEQAKKQSKPKSQK